MRENKNKKLIFACGLFIALASWWTYRGLEQDQEIETPKEVPTHVPQSEANHSDVFSSAPKDVNEDEPRAPAPLEANKAPIAPLAKSNSQLELKKLRVGGDDFSRFPIKDLKLNLITNAYACYRNECPNVEIYKTISVYHIVRGPSPQLIERDSHYAVFENPNNKLIGVWEKKVIITFNESFDQTVDIKDLGLSPLKILGAKIALSYYEGELGKLTSIINQLKQIEGIESVELDIIYQTKKPI